MAKSKTKKRGRGRGRGRSARGFEVPRLPVPHLEPHQLDLIGLGLIAFGIFLGLTIYFGLAGGDAGRATVRGLRLLFGQIAYAVPVALAAGGFAIVLREFLPAVRPIRTGAICLFAAISLSFAAGTFGLGPNGPHGPWFAQATIEPRGGAVGEGLYWGSTKLFSDTGAHILAVFLLIAALILLSGATIAGLLRATGNQIADTGRRMRRGPQGLTPERFAPPEPEDEEILVSAGPAFVEELAEPLDEAETFEPEPEPELLEEYEDVPEEPPPPLEVDPEDLTPQGRYRGNVTEDPDFEWRVPSARFLKRSTAEQAKPDTAGQEKTAAALMEALGHFGIQGKVVAMVAGPHITRYELKLAPGTKMSKVANLKEDLAYALAATDVRILAPIPGKQAVGVEVPNQRRRIVHLGDVFSEPVKDSSPLSVWLGKDVSGKSVGADLAKMPHLLVAGTTGAGKSGCVNAMLSSVLLRATPHEVRVVLVDPKQVELNHYEGIPHLLTPVITSPRMAANALQNLVKEMEARYGQMSLARTRSLVELNRARAKRDEPPLPYVLCVIDELADLMMVAPADVEDSIIRLAQKARAVGIHLVLATQSPRVDVITGMIKANVPSRIAFAVSSQTDSRVILDQNGAESLLGQGDMLFSPVGSSRLQRIQGAYIDEEEIYELTEHWRRQGEPEFREELLEEVADADETEAEDDGFDPDEDPLLADAISLVGQMGTASTSMLQRRMRLGYTRAGRLIDMLERRGVISGYEGSKPRQVLITEADVPRVLANLAEAGRLGGADVPEDVTEPLAPAAVEGDGE